MRKTISVNDPLRYGGFTIYQTDWSLSALQILRDDEGPFNLAMAPLKINGDKKLYGTFLPVGSPDSPDVKGMYVTFSTVFSLQLNFPCRLWLLITLSSVFDTISVGRTTKFSTHLGRS